MSADRPTPTLGISSRDVSRSEPFGLWGRAFRPFFLGLGVYGALAIPWWTLAWLGIVPLPVWLVPMWWHAHEMIFGFAAAAIAGFLLTASPVWTGGPALTGVPLMALFLLWVSGRIAFASAGAVSPTLVALIDVAFLPAVGAAVLRTIWGSGQVRNYGILGLVGVLASVNAAIHAEALALVSGIAPLALRFAVDLVVVLIIVIGGRITPPFTQNALRRRGFEHGIRSWPWLNGATVGAAVAMAASGLILGRSPATGFFCTVAGLAVLVRLSGWQTWQTRSDPLLWSLHAASFWVGLGLLIVGASDLGASIPPSAGLHALTAGGIGGAIIAVTTRVGLGHTGRPLELPRGVVWCYVLVQAAAIARVAATFAAGESHRGLLLLSGFAWAGAFGFFALRYWPILTTPRPDGNSG